jgi:uncharacterized protein (DUF58 family)
VESNLSFFTVVPGFPVVHGLAVPRSPRHQPGGIALASRTGEALELMGVRPYQPGDRIRDLHPATWGRTGVPHVRHYHQEYFFRTAVVLDVNTRAGRVSERRFEASISLAAGCLAALVKGEALVDLLVCCEQAEPLTIGRRTGTLDMALDVLACLEARRTAAMDALKDRLAPLLPRLSSLVFITLDDDDGSRDLTRWISDRGVNCRVLAVGTPPSGHAAQVEWVAIEPVESHAEVVL